VGTPERTFQVVKGGGCQSSTGLEHEDSVTLTPECHSISSMHHRKLSMVHTGSGPAVIQLSSCSVSSLS
jgi:hypothetical protein